MKKIELEYLTDNNATLEDGRPNPDYGKTVVIEHEVAAVPKSWDAFEFVSRFTPSERTAIRNAAKVVEALDDFMFMLDMAAKSQTRLVEGDPLLENGMDALVAGGLLTAERKAEIMS